MDKQNKEILCITQEECAEVSQAISKIFRFGIDSEWNGKTNKQRLEEEIGDLCAMIQILTQEEIISSDAIDVARNKKLTKLSLWSSIDLTNYE
jgi:NTP pyrophosphatase (non-canonical NTP hydrolase)